MRGGKGANPRFRSLSTRNHRPHDLYAFNTYYCHLHLSCLPTMPPTRTASLWDVDFWNVTRLLKRRQPDPYYDSATTGASFWDVDLRNITRFFRREPSYDIYDSRNFYCLWTFSSESIEEVEEALRCSPEPADSVPPTALGDDFMAALDEWRDTWGVLDSDYATPTPVPPQSVHTPASAPAAPVSTPAYASIPQRYATPFSPQSLISNRSNSSGQSHQRNVMHDTPLEASGSESTSSRHPADVRPTVRHCSPPRRQTAGILIDVCPGGALVRQEPS